MELKNIPKTMTQMILVKSRPRVQMKTRMKIFMKPLKRVMIQGKMSSQDFRYILQMLLLLILTMKFAMVSWMLPVTRVKNVMMH